MNVALELAKVLAQAVGGTLGKNVHVGRIQASKTLGAVYAVSMQGGNDYGGNVAKHKTRTQLEIAMSCTDPTELYTTDDIIRSNLSKIPYTDKRFLVVNVGRLQDNQVAESERRLGTWSVEVISLNLQEG